jgi:hypothetical protein
MNKIIKSMLMMVVGLGLLTACSDDTDSNPTVVTPTKFVLNTPAAANQPIDLTNSTTVNLTCSQPDYGFPASTGYTVQVSLKSDMSDSIEIAQVFSSVNINLDAYTLASALTQLELSEGKTEQDFPLVSKVYLRLKAQMLTSTNSPVPGTEILSNVISLDKVMFEFSLPPVTVPEKLYVMGNFTDGKWDKAVEMVMVNGTTNVFWAMVYVDADGIMFNSAMAYDGNEVGYAGLNSVYGDLASQIKDNGGKIASDKPQWTLMVVSASVSGRTILYDVQFLKPEVWLMGPCIGDKDWKEQNPAGLFSVPADAKGSFESPAFTGAVPGGDGDGVRVYVKVPGYDWWKSEFIVISGKIVYRGTGGDQQRVAGSVGQKMYLNFATGTGEIK